MSYFTGGSSFMSNGYVIWRDGLNGEPPNPYGVKQGGSYATRMFYSRSLDVRSSFYKFITYLQAIQKKEADKERQYINLKFGEFKKNAIDQDLVKAIQKEIDAGNFGLAYTLITERDLTLAKLKEELKSKHYNNISHMNKFWKAQLSAYIEKVLAGQVEVRDHQLMAKLDADSNITIESLIDGWFDELLYDSKGVILESLEPIRKQIKEDLLKYFKNSGIEGVDTISSSIFGTSGNITRLRKFKTTRSKRGGDKTIDGLVREVGNAIGNSVGLGMAMEIQAAAQQAGKNAASFNTGTIKKKIRNEFTGIYSNVQQKVDITTFEVFSGTYDIQKTVDSVFEDQIAPLSEKINNLREKLEEDAKFTATDIFEISTNVKGYRSTRDLQIEGEGSFGARASNLVKMAREAQGIPSFSMEKLIFMLNNTVDGCIADMDKEGLASYIAAVCVAWMWDDYTDLFSLEEKSNIKKIRLFNSGGFYYSASQIIQQTLSELLNKGRGSSFVAVDINPPNFDADSMYAGLKSSYPIKGESHEEIQASLAPRWNAMRDYVQSNGTISIKFQQSGLEEIIGKLRQFL